MRVPFLGSVEDGPEADQTWVRLVQKAGHEVLRAGARQKQWAENTGRDREHYKAETSLAVAWRRLRFNPFD